MKEYQIGQGSVGNEPACYSENQHSCITTWIYPAKINPEKYMYSDTVRFLL